MPVSGGPSRSERKKSEILTAARGVFLREGYPDAGMELVARMAGISTATLYAYFPSKANLFETVVRDAAQGLAGPARDKARVRGDVRTRLMALALAYAGFMSQPSTRAMFRMVTSERRRFEAAADYFQRNAHEKLGGAVAKVIEDLAEAGELAVDRPACAAGQLLGMLDHATLLLGLTAGNDAQPPRPLTEICGEAVETFLARYGNPKPSPGVERVSI